jgi:hypothetical protein
MLDQSFSLENFKTIFEIQNRKGSFEKDFFSKEYLELTEQLNDEKKKLSPYAFIDDDEDSNSILEEIENITKQREEQLEQEFLVYSQEVNQPNFGFEINHFFDKETDKTIYTVSKSPVSYFTMKQLQYNIFRCFKVKQTDRYQIVKQVKAVLQDNLSKYVVRTDIKSFYESVPQKQLLQIINGNQLLSPKSNKLIQNLIYHYNRLSGQLSKPMEERVGVPRGAGISAYLSELYMREVDERISRLPDVTYYGRYVDDIIVIFTPSDKLVDSNKYLEKIENVVKQGGLSLNQSKTDQIDLFDSRSPKSIKFLGYEFKFEQQRYKDIYLSPNKIKKYNDRLEAVFKCFLKDKVFNYFEAKRLLIHRLNYLTKNTHLHRPKKGLIGIYYSNSLLEKNSSCLDKLNNILYNMIDKQLPSITYPELNIRLKRFCFRRGFVNKLFFNIESAKKKIPDSRSAAMKSKKKTFNNFERIVAAWK